MFQDNGQDTEIKVTKISKSKFQLSVNAVCYFHFIFIKSDRTTFTNDHFADTILLVSCFDMFKLVSFWKVREPDFSTKLLSACFSKKAKE